MRGDKGSQTGERYFFIENSKIVGEAKSIYDSYHLYR